MFALWIGCKTQVVQKKRANNVQKRKKKVLKVKNKLLFWSPFFINMAL